MDKVHRGLGFGLETICWHKIVVARNIKSYVGCKLMGSIFYYSTLRGFLNE